MYKKKIVFVLFFFYMLLPFVHGQYYGKNQLDCDEKIYVILYTAQLKLGCQYEWEGTGPVKFDCSGFVQYVFKEAGIILTRTTATQCMDGEEVYLSNIKKGDIVFFVSKKDGIMQISHVGIAISDYADGDFSFIHASSSKGCVCISKFTDSNYKKKYGGARRIVICNR